MDSTIYGQVLIFDHVVVLSPLGISFDAGDQPKKQAVAVQNF